MKTLLAVLNKQEKNVIPTVLSALKQLPIDKPVKFGLVLPSEKPLETPNAEFLEKLKSSSPSLIVYVTSNKIKSTDFLTLEDASVIFDGRLYEPLQESIITEQIKKSPDHCEAILQTLIEEAEGDYSFFMLRKNWIAAGRDPIGVQPLYYGENDTIAAFASNKKVLWKLGIGNAASFPSGNLAFLNHEGFQFKPAKTFTFEVPKPVTMQEASEKTRMLLENSIKKRVAGLKEVAVAFSGGLDSGLVAFLAGRHGVKVTLVHVSLENQAETQEAIKAADKLNLPLQIHLFKESDVEKTLPKVLELIEESDPVKASIGIPFYWTAEKSVEAGFKALLAGQGADELFGGYMRYVNECCLEGTEKVAKTMFNDVIKIQESNLERDNKICRYHDVELLLPFASFELAQYALTLPVDLKFEQKTSSLRKLVLRKTALDLGLPMEIVEKPKKAVQYSTGINGALKKIAKKHGKTISEYVTELFLKQVKA